MENLLKKSAYWMHDLWAEDLTAQQNAPAKPYLTDQWEPTDEPLWLRVLQVAKGRKREMTRVGPDGPRTIHAPNKGRGFRHWPNQKAVAWAVKQYNGYGGRWKGHGEEETKAASEDPVFAHILALKNAVDASQHTFEDVLERRVRVGVEGDSGRDMLRAEQAGLFTTYERGVAIYAHTPEDAQPLVDYLRSGGSYGSLEFSQKLGYNSTQIQLYRRYRIASAEAPQPDHLNPFQQTALERLRQGAVLTALDDTDGYFWLTGLEQKGFVRMIEANINRKETYWDLADERIITANLGDDLKSKIERLLSEDELNIPEANQVAKWLEQNFRFKSPRTPKGQKDLKGWLENLWWSLNTTLPGYRPNLVSDWAKIEPRLADVTRYFTDEGGVVVPREVERGQTVYVNKAGLDADTLEKYSKRMEQLLGTLRGWRAKALTGKLKIVFASPRDFTGTVAGKYRSAEDALYVRVTPKILKRDAGYGGLDYIIIHELGHRYEHKVGGLPTDFDKVEWWTTRYSRTEGMGGSESFAELFAIGHFGITGNWDHAIVERFEKVMT